MTRAARIEALEQEVETLNQPKPPAGPVLVDAGGPGDAGDGGESAATTSPHETVDVAVVEDEAPAVGDTAETAPAGAAADEPEAATTTSVAVASRAELERELEEARTEKAELEKRHAALVSGGGVPIGEVRVTTGLRLKGKVLVVNDRYRFVVIDLGARDGVEKGMVLIVHRDKKFIGKCQVGKVYNRMSAADLVTDWMKDDVVVGDGVRKF
jgi:hypothetical protein